MTLQALLWNIITIWATSPGLCKLWDETHHHIKMALKRRQQIASVFICSHIIYLMFCALSFCRSLSQEDELHAAAADRDQSEILKLLAKKHTKLPWKPEVSLHHCFLLWLGFWHLNDHFPKIKQLVYAWVWLKKKNVKRKWKCYLELCGILISSKSVEFQIREKKFKR